MEILTIPLSYVAFGVVVRILVHMIISIIRPTGKSKPIVVTPILLLLVVLYGEDVFSAFTVVNFSFCVGFFFLEFIQVVKFLYADCKKRPVKEEKKNTKPTVKRKPRVHKIDGRKVTFYKKGDQLIA